MKEIKAFIRPERLIKVAENLKNTHHCCFTVFEGEGAGNFIDPEMEFPTLKFPFLHDKVVKIEIVCETAKVDEIVEILRRSAQTGERGDGLIYVSAVEDKIRIRDGKSD